MHTKPVPLRTILLAIVAISKPLLAQDSDSDWIARSNKLTQPALMLLANFQPEMAGRLGIDGFDENIRDLSPNLFQRRRDQMQTLVGQLAQQFENESHPKIKQDLRITLQALNDQLTGDELNHRLMLPYYDVASIAFQGIRALLDDNVDPSRYPAALVRLKKYAGLDGSLSLIDMAKARMMERFNAPGLVGPYARQLKQDMANSAHMLQGIAGLMQKYEISDWEPAHSALAKQVKEFNAWVKEELLPRARENHLLPAEIYADNLKQFGVYADPEILMELARFGFAEIRSEMNAIAKRIAAERGWQADSFKDVVGELKREQLARDEILSVYEDRLAKVEDIIRRENIVTLPKRKARIRFASLAESAQVPAPSMKPPRLIGNTGQYGEFLIPLRNPNAESEERMDDFLHDAITWSLTAHEARPGHEMQFSALVEGGVSIPRVVFAVNSANVEGWGMYSEAIMKEHFPLEGQFFTLYARLARASRAFLDPMLNLGEIEPQEAKRFLIRELLLSEPMATQEIDRYTFRAPGQATSYYYGLMKLESLRTQTEIALGDQFDQRQFHDFILAQGPLPFDLLGDAVTGEFIPALQTFEKK